MNCLIFINNRHIFLVLFLLQLQLHATFQQNTNNPCDIRSGFGKSGRIQFEQDTKENTKLYELPFLAFNSKQIKEIQIKSNEINKTLINKYFQIKFKTLYLVEQYDLDQIKIDFIELLFQCVPSTVPLTQTANIGRSNNSPVTTPLSNTQFLLYVTIKDVNTYAPVFVNTPYMVDVKEMTPIGTIVYKQIKAIDNDLPNRQNSQVSYSIIKRSINDTCSFPLSTNGDLAVKRLFEYDDKTFKKCELIIKAEDHGIPAKNSLTNVVIHIIDIDNKDPQFTHQLYNATINHNALVNTFIDMVYGNDIKAFDMDYGLNETVKYQLHTNIDNLFGINETSGKVFLKKQLLTLSNDNYKQEYNIIIKAIQANDASKSAMSMLNIKVNTLNKHEPKFVHKNNESNYYEAFVSECISANNSFIIEIKAEDNKDMNKIEYKMKSIDGAHDDDTFLIEADSGIVRLNKNSKLDYESKTEYAYDLYAYDGKYTIQTKLLIHIQNCIDTPPKFEQLYYTFKLQSPFNEIFIGQVRALDVENTSTLTYSISPPIINKPNGTADQEQQAIFCISQTTGIIYICPFIDRTHLFNSNSNKDGRYDDGDNYLIIKEFNLNTYAQINTTAVDGLLKSRVDCRIQIINTNQVNNNTNGTRYLSTLSLRRFIDFKDLNQFYAYLSIICSCVFILFMCITIMIWYRCSNGGSKKHERPSLLNTSNNNTEQVNTISDNYARGGTNTGLINESYQNNSSRTSNCSESNIDLIIVKDDCHADDIKQQQQQQQRTHDNKMIVMTQSYSVDNDENVNVDEPLSINYETVYRNQLYVLSKCNNNNNNNTKEENKVNRNSNHKIMNKIISLPSPLPSLTTSSLSSSSHADYDYDDGSQNNSTSTAYTHVKLYTGGNSLRQSKSSYFYLNTFNLT